MKIKGWDRLKQWRGLVFDWAEIMAVAAGFHRFSVVGYSTARPAASFAWPPHSLGCCRWRLNDYSTLTYLAGGSKCLSEHHWRSVEAIPGLQRTWRLMSPFRLGPSNKSAIVLRTRYDFFLFCIFLRGLNQSSLAHLSALCHLINKIQQPKSESPVAHLLSFTKNKRN